jgi:molybdate transport system regulatory protein
MRAVNTLRLANKNVFFGPGPRQLLERVDALGSLRQASMDTGISYTKVLKLLKGMEAELGFAAVESEKGGSARGGTRLTEKGRRLLQAYAEAEREMDEVAQKLVREKFAFLERE